RPGLEQVDVLEDHPDLQPLAAQRALAQPAEGDAVDRHRAGGGLLQGGEAADERRLPGARLTDDPVDRAARDMEVDPVQRDDLLPTPRAVDLPQVVECDHRGPPSLLAGAPDRRVAAASSSQVSRLLWMAPTS